MKNFRKLNKVKPQTVKKEAQRLCDTFNLTKLGTAVRKSKGLCLSAFFTVKTHKDNWPFRVIVSEKGTWQHSMGKFLQDSLSLLAVEDPFQVMKTEEVSAFFHGSCPKGNACGISTEKYLEAMAFYLRSTFISFNNELFVQRQGVCIGSCVAPLLSDLLLAKADRRLKEALLSTNVVRVFRFVDDFLVVYKTSDQDPGKDVEALFKKTQNMETTVVSAERKRAAVKQVMSRVRGRGRRPRRAMGRFRRRPADLSPQPMYWDPRYQRYFFAGLLPPLPPETAPGLQQQPAVPVPSVELVPTKRTRRPSILVSGGEQGSRRDEREERHISWSSLGDEDGDNPAEDQAAGADSVAPSWRSSTITACLLVLVSLLVVATTLGVSGSLKRVWRAAQTAGMVATSSATALMEATNALADADQRPAGLDTNAPSASADKNPARTLRTSSRTTIENDDTTDDTTDDTEDEDVTTKTTTLRRAPQNFRRTRRVLRTSRASRTRRVSRRASTRTTRIA
ncbi:uncharacterized protein LOC144095176 [Amblyomma americanum]